MYADFEADNEIDTSSRGDELSSGVKNGNKTTNIYKRNPECIGYYIVSELNDVLKSGSDESPLGYNNANWYLDEFKEGIFFGRLFEQH